MNLFSVDDAKCSEFENLRAVRETYNYGLRFVRRDSHFGLFVHYRRRAVAERQRGRHLRGIRRSGEPDGFWSTRSDQCFVESHNLVGSDVHDHFDHAGGVRQQARGTDVRPARNQDATCEDATGSRAGASEEVTPAVTPEIVRRGFLSAPTAAEVAPRSAFFPCQSLQGPL